MKVLIVDDEQHVREAIKLLVDWEALGCESVIEAENGEMAIELVKQQQPQLILTDMMMPIKGGVDLLEWLQINSPSSVALVISGHDDYKLVRNTFKYGGLDYILKPVDPEQLNDALVKAKTTWEEQNRAKQSNQQRDMQLNQLKPVYWDKTFSSLITDPQSLYSVRDALENEIGLAKTVSDCQVAVLSINSLKKSLLDKYKRHHELLFFTLTNICNEFLRSDRIGFACRYWNREDEVLIFYWGASGRLAQLAERMNDGIQATLRVRIDIGIGMPLPFPEQLRQSYEQARTALQQRNLWRRDQWVHLFKPEALTETCLLRMTSHAEPMRLAFVSSHADKIAAAADAWLTAVKQCPVVTMAQLLHWLGEFEQLQQKWLQSISETLPATARLPLDEQGCLSLTLWREQLLEQLLALSMKYNKTQQQDKNIIHDIVKYIEENYEREITLQDIASHFYLSREHISRKFKQDLGENLSDFVSRIRMDKAQVLLLNRHLTISQVAEMVGYTDEKYFSKVFKKYLGMPPNQYRKLETT